MIMSVVCIVFLSRADTCVKAHPSVWGPPNHFYCSRVLWFVLIGMRYCTSFKHGVCFASPRAARAAHTPVGLNEVTEAPNISLRPDSGYPLSLSLLLLLNSKADSLLSSAPIATYTVGASQEDSLRTSVSAARRLLFDRSCGRNAKEHTP